MIWDVTWKDDDWKIVFAWFPFSLKTETGKRWIWLERYQRRGRPWHDGWLWEVRKLDGSLFVENEEKRNSTWS